ncbi:MAG: hypothetical protein GDA36_03355 [Rhodobacteraceae bacterium]|nr:hypothetical protein [Paracoccaceae bacterium]
MSTTYTHQGLPDGVKPFDLPDMLEKLRTQLGLRDEDITYVRYLLRKVRAADFMPGRICAVWEAVGTQAADLGFNVRRITRIASRLEACGLVLCTASKGGRRFGRRDSDGRIVVAGGINLGPLIEQAGDLLRLVQHQAKVLERLGDSRQRANDLIRSIRGLEAEQAVEAARAIFPRLRPSEVNDTERLAQIIDALETILADFSSDNGRTIETAGSDSSGRPDTHQRKKTKTCITERPLRTTPAQVVQLASRELREIVEFYWSAQDQGGRLSWDTVMCATRDRALQLGISGQLWQCCCDQLGAKRTALCLMITDCNSERTDAYQVRDVAQAFGGMTRHEAIRGEVVERLLGELIAFAGGQQK